MKNNRIFLIAMLVVTVLLFLLRTTGLMAHIAISVLGLILLAVFTIMTRKDWTKPPMEILMRLFYLVAVVTGGALMRGVGTLGMVHKISAALFLVLLLVLYAGKAFGSAKNN